MATLTTSYQKIGESAYTVIGSNLLRLYAKYNSQSIPNNSSNVSIQLRTIATSGSYYSSQNSSTLTCNGIGRGTQYYDIGTVDTSSEKIIGTWTFDLGHDSAGNLTGVGIYASANVYGSLNPSVTGSFDLPRIPRASTVACSSPYIGDTAIITIDKKSTAFTSTVTYNIGGITGIIAEKISNTVLSLNTDTLKSQIYALIPNARSTSGTIYCTTYNGNTQIGSTQSATFNLYAKEEDCKPTVSGVVIDTNQDTIDLTGDNSIIVKNTSKPKVTISATPNYSSTISSYSINLNDGQTSNLQEDTFDTINSNSIIVDATDSREYSNPVVIDLSNRIIDYIKVHFNTIELKRPESTSNQVILNANGVWFNGDFSQLNSNTLSCSFQYKKSADNSWTNGGTITPTITNNVFTFINLSLGNSFDYEDEYQFKIIATDLLMTVGNDNKDAQTVPKGIAVVEIGDEFVNVNGNLTKNDIEVPTAQNTYNSSQVNTYSCDYINRNIITIDYDRYTFNTSQWTSNKITHSVLEKKVGNKLTYSNDSIIIGDGVSAVKVNALINSGGASRTGDYAMEIRKISNGVDTWVASSYESGTHYYFPSSIPDKLIDVSPGDVLYITTVYSFGGSFAIEVLSGHLTVEVVQ